MKKVLSFVLIIAMVLSSMSFAFAGTFEDMDDHDYEDAVNALAGLGIIDGYEDGTYKPENIVTRAEMAKLMVEILGYGDLVAGSKSNFADTQDHWADQWIALAAGRGIVIGTGDGNFAPERQVSYDEVLTMIVRGLGYTDDSNEIKNMPWPTNFKIKAAEVGITDGVKMATAGADRGGVAKALYNALEATLVTVDVDGNVIYLKQDDVAIPLLSRIADPKTITVGPEHLNESSRLYAGDIVDLAPYMYQSIDVYVNKLDNDEVIYIESSNSLVVEGTVDKVTATTIDVKDANGKITKVPYKIDGDVVDVDMYYNGVEDNLIDPETRSGDAYKAFDLIKIVGIEAKNDSNGKLDAKEITGFVIADQTKAARVDREYVDGRDRLDVFALPVDSSDDVDLSKVKVEGAVDDIYDIEEDDVVVEYAAYNGRDVVKTRLVVSRNVVDGKITRDDSANDAFYIDGVKYSVNKVAAPALELGDEGVFYLDHNDKIVDFDGEASGPANYAVVLGAADGILVEDKFSPEGAEKRAIDDYAQLKLATAEDEVVTYDIYVKLNSAGTAISSGLSDFVTFDGVNDELVVDAGLVRGVLVKYSLNSNGKISKLEVVAAPERGNIDTTKSTFRLASNAVIFDAGEDFEVVSEGRLESTLVKPNVVYNSRGEIEVLITSNVKAGAALSYARLDKIERGYNADDEVIQVVTVYMNGEKVTLNNESDKTFVAGDITSVFTFDLDGNDIKEVDDASEVTAVIADISFGTRMIKFGTSWLPLAEKATVVEETSATAEDLADIYDLDDQMTVRYVVDDGEIVFVTIIFPQPVSEAAADLLVAEAAAEALVEAEYTPASWLVLTNALESVDGTTQEKIDKTAAIYTAIDELVARADFSVLTALIEDAKALVETEYTPESWTTADIAAAIDAAELVEADLDSTQAEVDAAVEALQADIDKLVDVVPEP